MVLRIRRASGHDRRSIAFAGCTDVAVSLNDTFRAHGWMGIDVVGYFDDRAPTGNRPLAQNAKLEGTFADLIRKARNSEISAVYICLPMAAEKRVRQLVDELSRSAVSVHFCPSFFEFGLMNARWDDVFGQPVVSLVDSPFVGHQRVVKHAEDLVLALLLLPIVLLPMFVIALAVAATSRGPILYRQTRYGLDGRSFEIWKFRTMYVVERNEEFRQAARDDARVTPLGAFLRRTSLDELPQVFNVIHGEMSFVGPRPHPVKLNETHRDLIDRYMLRHKVKPGITGLAQVNGFRGETSERGQMAKRIEYDLMYIRNWSLWLDCKILARTVSVVWSGENAH
jgi:putative colanic acid biosynthesis UDP-glucose lipid carrier transferase